MFLNSLLVNQSDIIINNFKVKPLLEAGKEDQAKKGELEQKISDLETNLAVVEAQRSQLETKVKKLIFENTLMYHLCFNSSVPIWLKKRTNCSSIWRKKRTI